MRILISLLALAVAPAVLSGQLTWNTVTVTASRSANAEPSQAVLNIIVNSGTDQGLDDVVKVLASSGITAANLLTINLQPNTGGSGLEVGGPLQWVFRLTVPVSKLKDTTASLTLLQQAMAQKKGTLSLSFTVEAAQSTAPAMPNCDLAGLMADARAQARKLAGGAGFTPGAIVGISGNVADSTPICSLTVRFALGATLGQSAQSGPNFLAMTATQTVNAAPDQALISLSVTSGLTTALDEVLGALAAAGIAGAQFAGVSSTVSYDSGSPQTRFNWTFTFPTPLSRLGDTLAQLAPAQQAMAKQNPALTLAVSVDGVQAAQPSQTSCQEADLVADAKTTAQKLASAAGVSLGGILNLSEGGVPFINGSGSPASRQGDFSALLPAKIIADPYGPTGTSVFFLGAISSSQYTCSVSLQFQIL